MNYTNCLLTTLLIANSSIVGMEQWGVFVPTVFGDKKFISEDGRLQRFDLKETYQLLENQHKNTIENPTNGHIQDALTTIGLLSVSNDDIESSSLLNDRIKTLFDVIKKQGVEQDLTVNMCGLFEELQNSVVEEPAKSNDLNSAFISNIENLSKKIDKIQCALENNQIKEKKLKIKIDWINFWNGSDQEWSCESAGFIELSYQVLRQYTELLKTRMTLLRGIKIAVTKVYVDLCKRDKKAWEEVTKK
jgi:hypothetical protein